MRYDVVLACWAYRSIAAAALALPGAVAVGALVGDRTGGDAALFEQGGLLLVECARLLRPVAAPARPLLALCALALALGWLVPFGAQVLAEGSARRLGLGALLLRAAARLPALVVLMGATWLAQALVLVAGWVGARRVGHAFGLEMVSDLARLGALAAAGALAWCIAVTHDVARALVLERGLGPVRALGASLALVRAAPFALAAAAGGRTALAVALFLAAGAVTLGARAPLAVVVAAPQLALFGFVLLRASWLGALHRIARERTPDGSRSPVAATKARDTLALRCR
jgi:hypothetical protein